MTTITVPRALLEQALEAMYEETAWFGPTPKGAAAITALRAALAQQAEPVNVAGPAHLAPKPAPGLEFDERGVLVPQQTEPVPMPPFPPVSQWNRGCAVCGIGADGKAYGYVCSRSDCPTKVTCGGVA